MGKLNPVPWLRYTERAPAVRQFVARVWRVTSCDAMQNIQLTFAPWSLSPKELPFEASHLAVVNAIDADGNAHFLYVHEHSCRVQFTYSFLLSDRVLWMEQNDEAPMGHEALAEPSATHL